MTTDREAQAELEALDHAKRVLAAYREGDLTIDDQHTRIRFVNEHATGRLIASVPSATFFGSHLLLSIPDETEDALHLLLSAEEVDESRVTDRWLAFHLSQSGYSESATEEGAEQGREYPDHTKWAALWIDSAKHGPWVFDGDALMLPNPLADLEPAACKQLNQNKPLLAKLCSKHTGADNPMPNDDAEPTCVGVDPAGIYARLSHGVVHIPFPDPTAGDNAKVETVDTLLEDLIRSVQQ